MSPAQAPPVTYCLRVWRSGSTDTTSHARPTRASPRITSADGSSSQRPIPWRADVGNAWWLLCHDSPNVISDSQNTLRDSSGVLKRLRPKTWQIELMLNVTWCSSISLIAPPHSSGGERRLPGAAEQEPETEGRRDAPDGPHVEPSVDKAHDRVCHQVGRVAVAGAALVVHEQPADVRVHQPAQRAAQADAVVDVGTVGVAWRVGEGVVLAVIGDPRDHRTLDRGGAEDREHGAQDGARLEAAVREEAVEADRDAQTGQDVQHGEDRQVPGTEEPIPGLPCREGQRERRHSGHQPCEGAVEVLVDDGLDVGRTWHGPRLHYLRRGHEETSFELSRSDARQ